MYPGLISSGVSQLYSLLQSQIQPSSSSNTSSASTTSGAQSTSGTGGASFSNDLNQLLQDIQSGASTSASTSTGTGSTGTSTTGTSSTDPTTTVADDLQNVFSDLQKAGAGQGHHHHHHHSADADTASSQTAATSQTSGAPTASNPFQSLASSLLAYASTQGLTSTQSASTSLTA